MWKKAVLRGLLGIPMGVFIGYTVTILISLTVGDGVYTPAVPALIEEYGEMGAVGLQYLLAALLGGACAAGSVIWQIEDWSILKTDNGTFFCLVPEYAPHRLYRPLDGAYRSGSAPIFRHFRRALSAYLADTISVLAIPDWKNQPDCPQKALKPINRRARPVVSTGRARVGYKASTSLSHRAALASEGIRQSPRGESATLPTRGPSGKQERLNCWEKNRRRKVRSQALISSPLKRSAKAVQANR